MAVISPSGTAMSTAPTVTTKTDPASWAKRTRAVAKVAAELYINRFKKSTVKTLGIVWGRTHRAIIDAIVQARPRLKHITCVALYGEPIWHKEHSHDTDSSTLAHDLAQATQATAVPLSPVPASIPKSFSQDAELLRKFFHRLPNYQKAIAYFDKLDAIICGVGAVADTAWANQSTREDFEGMKRGEWPKKVLGIFAGWYFAQPGYEDTIAEINARSLGAHLDYFKTCYAKAAASNGDCPGVLVAAHGKGKAPILAHVIKRKCINHLVLDYDLARGLLALARSHSG